MQSNIFRKPLTPILVVQIRNHVKMYPWRKIRTARESYLDNTKTPYTEGHNINEFIAAKKQKKPWQIVKLKDKDSRYNSFHWNPLYESDPAQAKEFSLSSFRKFEESVMKRGPSRESKAYDPPEDVSDKVLNKLKEILLSPGEEDSVVSEKSLDNESLLSVKLNSNSLDLKFRLITECIKLFNHDLPSSYLNDIETVHDVIEYFCKPVVGLNPYDTMVRNQSQNLPGNLHLIAEAIRFDRETDTFFKGVTALPGQISSVPGLRAAKKYSILNNDEFQWPDI